MGFQFSLSDANIVAYLTSKSSKAPPRLTWAQASNFFHALEDPTLSPAISASADWIKAISQSAKSARGKLAEERAEEDRLIPDQMAHTLLSELQGLLSRFDLFALGCN